MPGCIISFLKSKYRFSQSRVCFSSLLSKLLRSIFIILATVCLQLCATGPEFVLSFKLKLKNNLSPISMAMALDIMFAQHFLSFPLTPNITSWHVDVNVRYGDSLKKQIGGSLPTDRPFPAQFV